MSDTLDDLLGAIGVAAPLPGARCRGRHRLFDEAGKHEPTETVAARHAQAIGLCRLCPALASCQRWYDSLPAHKRPAGVVAGRVRGARGTPGRPRATPPQADSNNRHGKAAS